jgi:hypothetical protein
VIRTDCLAILVRCPVGPIPTPEELGRGFSWSRPDREDAVLSVP